MAVNRDMEFKESVINAFCHSDYHNPDYIHITAFNDHVEVRNPGGLYDGLTLDDIRQGHVSKRRNPMIAEFGRPSCMQDKYHTTVIIPTAGTMSGLCRDQALKPLLEAGLIEMTIPDKPRSSRQRYWLTAQGELYLAHNKEMS